MKKKRVALVLSGCGVYDGSEIQESVLTMLALDYAGVEYKCYAPDIAQHHVINHLKGEEMSESRNVLVESARIARGNIQDVSVLKSQDADAVIFPGGFGVAKNFTKWAFEGPKGGINDEIQRVIRDFVAAGKPVGALCMAPTTLAKALEGTKYNAHLTVGNVTDASPYEISAISAGMSAVGAHAEMCEVDGIVVDEQLNIVTCPCYMMEASISQVDAGIKKLVSEVLKRIIS